MSDSTETETHRLSKKRKLASPQLDIIEELWSKKQFCDVTVIVNDEKFQVHKIILASHIPYFKEMFSKDKYKESNAAEIKLSDLDPKIMSFILEYIYGRELEVTREIVIKILHRADYLMMNDLKEWCEEQLMSTTSEETCIEYFLLSRRYQLPELNSKTKYYFYEHSYSEPLQNDCLPLSKEEFSELWTRIDDTQGAYEPLMKWIKHDLDNRKGFLYELLKKLPQYRMSSMFFKTMAEEELLKENHQCCKWLLELATSLLFTPPAYSYCYDDSDSD